MFKFLKDKLKNVVKSVTKEVEEQAEEQVEEVVEQPVEKPKVTKEKKTTKKDADTAPKKPAKSTPKKSERVTPKEKSPSKQKVAKEKVEKKTVEEVNTQPEPPKLADLEPVEEVKPEPPKKEAVEGVKPDIQEEKVEEPKPKKGLFSKLFKKEEQRPEVPKTPEPEKVEQQKVDLVPKPPEDIEQEPTAASQVATETKEPEEKKGFFQKIKSITTSTLKEQQFEEIFFELELALLESNVSVQVIEKIKEDMKSALVGKPIPKKDIEQTILQSLKYSVEQVVDIDPIDLEAKMQEHQPLVIMALGINGSGKTTSLAKIAHYFQQQNKTVVLAACDTFRAAAIQQLEEHANNLNIKLIKHDYGADPAAVAFDAIEHAKAKQADVVLLDTAGRLHSNSNLMDELKKVVRVAQPHMSIFVGESTTGNDCVDQATQFNALIGVDAIVLTKADVDQKGGAALSISYVTGKPILFIGMGQNYEDLQRFDKQIILDNLGL